jgi:ribosomal protein S18 acetylase RimI-like enzyme
MPTLSSNAQGICFEPIPESQFDDVFDIMKVGLEPFVAEVFGWDDDFQRQRIKDDYEWPWMHWVKTANETIGLVCFKRYERAIHLHLIVIQPQYAGTGYGKKVMNVLHDIAAAEQRDITLSSFKVNLRAVALYKSLGYDIETEEEHFLLFRRAYRKD